MGTVFASSAGSSHVFCPSCVGRVEALVSHDDTGVGFSDFVPHDAVTVVRCVDCRLVLRVEVDLPTTISVPTGGERRSDGGAIHAPAVNHAPGELCSHLRVV
ncbi:MAG: hypothetical protein DWI50_00605 [Chloroflexi bacterium]|nr:MAG: hypothetical protein DWI50_00605 [Chloroflexota bacterium]